jgi:DNA-binding response OmpR family regulator
MLMKPKILIIDDDQVIRASLVKVMERKGYELLQACNGADAIDIFRSSAVDLVVLDVNLKDEDGWSILEAMKELNSFVPIVITTREFDQREKAIAAGAEALMEKPMDVSVFLRIVQNLLSESSEQRLERVCGNDDYCRYVAGYLAPFLSQLDERHSAPLKLSESLSAVLATKFAPDRSQKTVQEPVEII